jgi:hypothetical protein
MFVSDVGGYGAVELSGDRIVGIPEKSDQGSGRINGGAYFFFENA